MKFLLLTAVIVLAMGCAHNGGFQKPNVILILIDTLRADHVHCYGYHRDITPTLDSLAASGTMWLNVQGQAAWTLPAMTTIFTGLTEREHLAGFRGDRLFGISPSITTLPEIFHQAGYQTAGFYNVPVMGQGYGFSQGMDYVDLQGCRLAVDADVINTKFLKWLDEFSETETPFFAVLHYFDPHYPYMPPHPWDGLFSQADDPNTHWASEPSEYLLSSNNQNMIDQAALQRMVDLYDGEIAFMDSELGNLMRELRMRELSENTIVVVIADHGEEFREHGGLLHGFSLFREITGIPLIFNGPGVEMGKVDSLPASQLDVLPTLLALCRIDEPMDYDGIDLLSGNTPGRFLPSSGFASDAVNYVLIRRDADVAFWNPQDGTGIQFNLDEDPFEMDSLPLDSSFIQQAEWYWSTPSIANPNPVPDTQSRVQALKNLGYFH